MARARLLGITRTEIHIRPGLAILIEQIAVLSILIGIAAQRPFPAEVVPGGGQVVGLGKPVVHRLKIVDGLASQVHARLHGLAEFFERRNGEHHPVGHIADLIAILAIVAMGKGIEGGEEFALCPHIRENGPENRAHRALGPALGQRGHPADPAHGHFLALIPAMEGIVDDRSAQFSRVVKAAPGVVPIPVRLLGVALLGLIHVHAAHKGDGLQLIQIQLVLFFEYPHLHVHSSSSK